MHESYMNRWVGKLIPEWDLAHRLPIGQPVGPMTKDCGTVFSVNSIYMDVIEPAQMEREWFLLGVLMFVTGSSLGVFFLWLTQIKYSEGGVFGGVLCCLIILFFGRLACKFGNGFVFGLLRRPIRFHRKNKKLYVMRKRRFLDRKKQGDIVWQASWSEDSIFCIHRENTAFGTVYHIRHYTVDEQQHVTQVFSIGREWVGDYNLFNLLSQWNYWCQYMNKGPAELVPPLLYHPEHETLKECFLYSFYSFGGKGPRGYSLMAMPHILVFTLLRFAANWSCRAPVWPEAIERISQITPDDPYAQPRGNTPIGWEARDLAVQRGDYPADPECKTVNWVGDSDEVTNLKRWLLENPEKT